MRTAVTKPRNQSSKTERCLAILERAANAGDVCPTNQTLAELLGYSSTHSPSGLVNLLEVSGFITIKRANTGRVVTIVRTGRKTAGKAIPRRPTDWTVDQDAIMMDGLAEGEGVTVIGHMLGKGKQACISRFQKITAQMGVQAS